MSIFKRSTGDTQQPGTATATQSVTESAQPEMPNLLPPFAGPTMPGVVPPAAAPMYSTRPPEPAATAQAPAETPLAEKVRAARETQERVKEKVRVAVQRARSSVTPTRGSGAARRPTQSGPPMVPRVARPVGFDPQSYAQVGLLNLAWRWQDAGAPIRAIHAYMEILSRYPGTPAAAAAVSDLVQLSEKLAEAGQFHTALAIYDQLECLA
jgi:hypothetical protein